MTSNTEQLTQAVQDWKAYEQWERFLSLWPKAWDLRSQALGASEWRRGGDGTR